MLNKKDYPDFLLVLSSCFLFSAAWSIVLLFSGGINASISTILMFTGGSIVYFYVIFWLTNFLAKQPENTFYELFGIFIMVPLYLPMFMILPILLFLEDRFSSKS